MKNVSVVAGIVTYDPDIHTLEENINSIIKQVDRIIIFDNGSADYPKINDLIQKYDILVIRSDKNKGIAYALNSICKWAYENGYKWALTLDQDSISPCDLVETLIKYAKENIAVVAPNIVYKNNEKYADSSFQKYEEVDWVITSASLTSINVWRRIKGFDNFLFIDGVDYDYCIRAKRAGYKIIRTYETEFKHELGQLKCRSILGHTIYVTNHSAFRRYYMTRNAIYIKHKLNVGTPVRTVLKYIIKVILFEENKIEKCLSILRGVYNGIMISQRKS